MMDEEDVDQWQQELREERVFWEQTKQRLVDFEEGRLDGESVESMLKLARQLAFDYVNLMLERNEMNWEISNQ